MRQPFFVRKLGSREGRELQRLLHSSRDAQVVRRAHVIRLSARGKTSREIADILGVTVSAIKMRVKRARETLRDMLGLLEGRGAS